MATVLITAPLGDLVKRIVELELRKEKSHDQFVQLTLLYLIVKKWPVSDANRLTVLIQRTVMQVSNYRNAETEMEQFLKQLPAKLSEESVDVLNTWNAVRACSRYSFTKKQLRDTYNELNTLGKGIGLLPTMIEVNDEEYNTVSVESAAALFQ